MVSKVIYKERKFLNRKSYHGLAAIYADIEVTTYKNSDGGKVTSIYPEISITDCSRKITLDLDIETKGSRQNTFYKLDLLIDVFTKMREKLEEVCEEYEVK